MTRESWLVRVREEERRILQEEGGAHVRGRYFADEHSANLERRWEAEVRASKAIARDALRRQGCNWCGKPITEDQESVSAAGAEIHRVACSEQFATFTAGLECSCCFEAITAPEESFAVKYGRVHERCRSEYNAMMVEEEGPEPQREPHFAAWPDTYKPWMH